MLRFIQRFVVTLVLVFGFTLLPAFPKLVGSGIGSSVQAKGRKTVKVRSYKKKNGTRVRSHRRSPPR